MTTHSSILAWKIPWAEEPAGLQFMGSQRVGHDTATEHECTNKPEVLWERKHQKAVESLEGRKYILAGFKYQ